MAQPCCPKLNEHDDNVEARWKIVWADQYLLVFSRAMGTKGELQAAIFNTATEDYFGRMPEMQQGLSIKVQEPSWKRMFLP